MRWAAESGKTLARYVSLSHTHTHTQTYFSVLQTCNQLYYATCIILGKQCNLFSSIWKDVMSVDSICQAIFVAKAKCIPFRRQCKGDYFPGSPYLFGKACCILLSVGKLIIHYSQLNCRSFLIVRVCVCLGSAVLQVCSVGRSHTGSVPLCKTPPEQQGAAERHGRTHCYCYSQVSSAERCCCRTH